MLAAGQHVHNLTAIIDYNVNGRPPAEAKSDGS